MMLRVLAVKSVILVLRVILGLLDLLQRNAVRLMLGLTVGTLLLHFTLNDPGLSSAILRKVSDILPGGIEASRIVWTPLTDELTILDVDIYRPGHATVIAAKRVDCSLRLGRLIVGALRSFLPFAPPIPLFFDRVLVQDAQVTLEFRERGLLLPEAFAEFEEEEEPHELGEKGSSPDLRIRGIEIVNAEVVLDFDQVWGLRVRGTSLNGAFYLKHGDPIVDVRDIFIGKLTWLGKLATPPQLDFMFQPLENLKVASYYLNRDVMEIGRTRVPLREGEIQVRGSIDAGAPEGPVFAALAELDISEAALLETLSDGQVSGPFQARANISGTVEGLALELGLTAPWLLSQGQVLEELSALLRWQSKDPYRLELPLVETHGVQGRLELKNLTVDLEDRLEATGQACVEDLDPVALLAALELEGLEDLGLWPEGRFVTQPLVTGCLEGSLLLDEDGPVAELKGQLWAWDRKTRALAFLDNAFLLEFKGAWGAGRLKLDELLAVSGDDWAELRGTLDLARPWPQVEGHLFLAGPGPLGLLPEDLSLGELELSGLSLGGSAQSPCLETTLAARELKLGPLPLHRLDARLELGEGTVTLEELCLAGTSVEGCVEARAEGLLEGLALAEGPWPVRFKALGPLRLEPWTLGLPLLPGGALELGRLEAAAVVSDRFPFLGGPLHFAGDLDWRLFSSGPVSLDRLRLTLAADCQRSLSLGCDLAAWLTAEGLQVGPVTSLRTVLGLHLTDLSPLGGLEGNRQAGLFVQGRTSKVTVGPFKFTRSRFGLDLPPGQDGRFDAAVRVTKLLLLEARGGLKRADLSGHLALKFANLERNAFPMVWQKAPEFNLLDGAVVEGQVELVWPALAGLLDHAPQDLIWLLELKGRLRASNLRALPQPVAAAEALFSLKRRQLELPSLHVILADGLGSLDLALSLNLASGAMKGSLETSSVPIHRLPLVAREGLPMRADLTLSTRFAGTLRQPEASGRLILRGVSAAGVDLGDAALVFAGGLANGLELRSESFFRRLELRRLMLRFSGLKPALAELDLAITELEPEDFLEGLDLPFQARLSGLIQGQIPLDGSAPPYLTLTVPAQALQVQFPELEEELWVRNRKEFRINSDGQAFETACLSLESPLGRLALWGRGHASEGWALFLGGDFLLDNHWLLNPYLSRHRISLELGGGADCSRQKHAVQVSGPLLDPLVKGRLVLDRSMVQPRQYPQEIDVSSGTLLFEGRPALGEFQVANSPQRPLKGVLEEGDVALELRAFFKDFLPSRLEARATGSNLFFKQANQFRLVLNPVLELELDNPLDAQAARGSLKGELHVTEGEYYRNFDKLLGSFANAFSSRSQERYSRPLEEVLPFVKKLNLDLGIHFTGLHVTSRFPFGETDMEVSASLRVKGNLAEAELYDRLSIIPGGSITYKVVRRDFEIVAGYVDFTGPLDSPAVDIKAQTYVRYIPSESYVGSISEDERRWGKDILIAIHVFGQYPELSFELSSENSEFDQADLQTLLLLGMTRADLENRVGATGMSINILTDDMTDALSGVLLSAFLDDVSLGFTQEGGIKAETVTRVGRAIELDTKVEQDQSTSEYSAGFRFMLTDEIFLEGRMKMRQEELETYRNYEGRIRYRMPLE